MSQDLSALLPALSALADKVGKQGLQVNLALCDDREVVKLKSRVAELEAANAALQARVNRAEFSMRCNSIVCNRVIDYTKEHGLTIPHSLYEGLDQFN